MSPKRSGNVINLGGCAEEALHVAFALSVRRAHQGE